MSAITEDKNVSKMVSEIVGNLTDPIICWPGYERDFMPDEMKNRVIIQRIAENMLANKEEREPRGTDAEVCWYLSTASQVAPMDSMWTRIYQYCFTKTMPNCPEDLKVEELDNYDMSHLIHFKIWLYEKRCAGRKDLERAERRTIREAAQQEKIVLQPVMFEMKGGN